MLFFVLSIPILPNSGWFSMSRELEVNRAFYGSVAHSGHIGRSQTRFNAWFVDTGMYQTSLDMTTPKATKRGPVPRGELVNIEVGMMRTYVTQFWDGMLRAIYRWEVNKHWYLIAIVSLFVGVNEGLCRKKIIPSKALYVNPANFHLIGHFLLANVIGSLLVLPWIPVVMTWWLWMIAIAVLTRFWVYAVVSMPSLASQKIG